MTTECIKLAVTIIRAKGACLRAQQGYKADVFLLLPHHVFVSRLVAFFLRGLAEVLLALPPPQCIVRYEQQHLLTGPDHGVPAPVAHPLLHEDRYHSFRLQGAKSVLSYSLPFTVLL